jgi:hypothetical protein
VLGLVVFVVLLCVGCISVVVVEGACVRDCRGLRLCKVWSAGVECVGERGSLVTGWEGKVRAGERVGEKGQSRWGGEQYILAQEKEEE